MAGRRPATVAGRSIKIEGAGERDGLVEPFAAAPKDELHLLPGMPLKERAFQAAGIVHRDAVDRLDEIAGSQPGAGGRARRFEILEDRSPESVLAPEGVYRPQSGAQCGGAGRLARFSPRNRGPGAGRAPSLARPGGGSCRPAYYKAYSEAGHPAMKSHQDSHPRQAREEGTVGFVRVRGAREHNLKNVDRRDPARRAGRVHRRLRLGQVVAGLRHALRRGAAALPRIGRRPTRGGCSTRWPCRRSTRSTACRRRSRCSSSAARRPRARRSAASRRSPTCCACSTRAPATIRRGQPHLDAEAFSPNTPGGRLPECHGLGRVYEVTERSMVPDDSLTIRERADRRLAAGVARAEPARHPDHARLRRRPPVARAAEEGPRLDPLHRRAADRAGLRRATRRRRRGARSSARRSRATMGTFTERAALRAAHLRHHAERVDEEARRRGTW